MNFMVNGFKIFCWSLATALVVSCDNKVAEDSNQVTSTDTASVDGHPAWIMQGNIYEVNVRQYTPQGNFAAFETHLTRLKEMGVQTLWFMPLHPISVVDRKGKMGSYYAIADYRGINPEYGSMEDWKSLVKKAHEMGFKVIIDWVPNHTGADHGWLRSHPDFYVKDSTGKPVSPFDWSDVRKLDYNNSAVRDSMISTMKFWVTETGIDGFRCDVAGELPDDFWKKCITELKQVKPSLFMLAEAEKASLHIAGFDATYPWDVFVTMKKIAKGEKTADALDSAMYKIDTAFPANAIKMYFTSNHDENSWSKADYETMPGNIHAPFAVLTHTLARSVPLIYSGQEEPARDSISFFYKDTIEFKSLQRADFYRTLLALRKSNPALAANAKFTRLKLGDDKSVYAFTRTSGEKEVLVIANLSNREQSINTANTPLKGSMTNVFTGRSEPVENLFAKLNPWDYLVFAR